jgi:hypothetical protein
MVVNSIEGGTVSERQEIANEDTSDEIASTSAVRNTLVIADSSPLKRPL